VLTHPAVLLVDEIGYLPITRSGAMLFFQLMTRRYEHASTVLTSNKVSKNRATSLAMTSPDTVRLDIGDSFAHATRLRIPSDPSFDLGLQPCVDCRHKRLTFKLAGIYATTLVSVGGTRDPKERRS
jgi:hypothetical protein